jgi:hypothetical protein
MKHYRTVSFALVFSSFIYGCGNQPALTQNDSMAVSKDYIQRHPEITPAPAGAAGAKVFYTSGGVHYGNIKVPETNLEQMRAAYLKNPLNVVDTNGQPVTGFVLDSADFSDLVNQASKVKTIGFHFGIRNFNYQADQQKPLYTLMVIPVANDWSVFPPMGAKTGTASPYGYDFVQPCPGSPGCPIINP